MRSIAGWFLVILGLTGFGVEIDNLRRGTTDSTVLGLILATVFVLGGRALIRSARRAKLPAEPGELLAMAPLPAMSRRDIERAEHRSVSPAPSVSCGSHSSRVVPS
ncbi:hypothetical protein OV208_36495 [Corallococcus sp. bb12-1]|uniref:hypothetical protein n=1 Tax=Corallococcus sp. bb12-1 TaxID=2996784 RepID=UPI00226F2997|nr:hypothetical protein [Corallococcus sp. bb12-1]MCY1046862.1 hypothetical protein [Corallococcus sp. bb12-1]